MTRGNESVFCRKGGKIPAGLCDKESKSNLEDKYGVIIAKCDRHKRGIIIKSQKTIYYFAKLYYTYNKVCKKHGGPHRGVREE